MLAFLVLMGCRGGGAWLNDTLSCPVDPYDWWGNLSYWADYGDTQRDSPRTLIFELVPGERYIENINGSYNTANGNFDVRVEYAGNYFIRRTRTDPDFENYGTVYRNGNLDVRAKLESVDVLGETRSLVRREERSGCEGEIRIRHGRQTDDGEVLPKYPDEVTEYSIVTDSRVDFDRTTDFGDGWLTESTGYWRGDFTTHEEVNSVHSGGSVYESTVDTDDAGRVQTSWTQEDGDLEWDGEGTQRVDGGEVQTYTVEYQGDDYLTVQYEVDYDGSGTGTETWHRIDKSCETEFDDEGNCERDCNGDCYTEP